METRKIYVGECENTGQLLGMVRFDRNVSSSDCEVSIILNPNVRGRGLSKLLLEGAIHKLEFKGQLVLTAKIKPQNKASIRCFES